MKKIFVLLFSISLLVPVLVSASPSVGNPRPKSDVVSGVVVSVSGASFVVETRKYGGERETILTTPSTIFDKNGKADARGIADITASSTVTVIANGLTATKVSLVIFPSSMGKRSNSHTSPLVVPRVAATPAANFPNRLIVTGILQAISGSKLTIVYATTTTYSVDAGKARVEFEHGVEGSIAGFRVGDVVRVWAKIPASATSTSVTASIVQNLSRMYNATQ